MLTMRRRMEGKILCLCIASLMVLPDFMSSCILLTASSTSAQSIRPSQRLSDWRSGMPERYRIAKLWVNREMASIRFNSPIMGSLTVTKSTK